MPTETLPYSVFASHDGGPYTRTDLPGTHFMTAKFAGFNLLGNDITARTSDPNWRVKLAKGQAATNPYTRTRYSCKPLRATVKTEGFVNLPGSIPRHSANGGAKFQPLIPVSAYGLNSSDAATFDIAVKRLKSRLSNQTNHFNAMVPIAELREMRGLIRSSAELAKDLVLKLLEIKKTRGRSAFKYASKAWLTFSFGISPMTSDTKALCESISSFLDRSDATLRVYGNASKQWKSSWKGGYTSAYGSQFSMSADVLHTLEYMCIAGVDFKVASANNYGVNQQFGLEFQELIPAAWELVPFSWVADYFGTVGDYLEDTFTSPAAMAKYVSISKKYTVRAQLIGGSKASQYFRVNETVNPGRFQYDEFVRTSSATIPSRSLRFKTADEIGANAVNRLLNLSALLVR